MAAAVAEFHDARDRVERLALTIQPGVRLDQAITAGLAEHHDDQFWLVVVVAFLPDE